MAGVWKKITGVFWAGLLSVEVVIALDLVAAMAGYVLTIPLAAVALIAGFALFLFWKKCPRAILAGALLLLGLLGVLLWRIAGNALIYANVDNGKAELYGNRNVMVIVPHEDDDLNIAGGLLEEYVRYGSEVNVVFVTNGDFYGLGRERINEAIACCGSLGIGEEHVIFLGYGDQWAEDGPHLYNGLPGVVYSSAAGYTQTYGTETHPAYRTGRDYTTENLLADIQSLVLEYRPDTIFCSDYDPHIDHRAVTLAFEKVMGHILQQEPDYTPTVYKAFAYGTAWEAEEDFFAENLGATRDLFSLPYDQTPAVYRWEERVRFPVAASSLSRSLVTTGNYRGMAIYASQASTRRAAAMTNSDKVAWQRRTDSLCYQADIQVSSGNGNLLNDFMLLECNDLTQGDMPRDGVWYPSEEDSLACATVTFPEPADIAQIVLYDSPDPESNVLDAVITFPDGTQVHTGALDPTGAATVIPVAQKDVSGFTLSLCQREGAQAGLSELEAYATAAQGQDRFWKLMDENGDFVYDYWMDESGTQEFRVYSYAADANEVGQTFTVTCQGTGCQAQQQGDRILVSCPRGSSCTVQIFDQTGTCRDSGVIRNPGIAARALLKCMQNAEKNLYHGVCARGLRLLQRMEKKILSR